MSLLEYGNWEFVRKIGSGSYGSVYEIEYTDEFKFTTKSALKVIRIPQSEEQIEELRNTGGSEEEVAEYFREMAEEVMKEVRLMYRLKGQPNIVSYLDHKICHCDDGVSWELLIRMELLTPMRRYIQDRVMTRKQVIKLGIDICTALEVCQKFNIIHRDIKPGNILVTEQGDYKLSDFGIARKVSEEESASMSRKGTLLYMAPEVESGKYESSVDMYSLGLVMYQLLNFNRQPFMPVYPEPIRHGDRIKATDLRMRGKPIPYPAQDNSRLAEIILKACSYEPKDRYSSPRQMKEDLEALLYTDADLEHILGKGGDVIIVPSSDVSITNSVNNSESSVKSSEDEDKTKRMKIEEQNQKEQFVIEEEHGKRTGTGFNKFFRGKVLAGIAVLCLLVVSSAIVVPYFLATTKVPNVTSMEIAEAEDALEDASLEVLRIDQANSDDIEKGKVIEVENQGKRVKKNSQLILVISLGARIIVPDEIGKESEKAADELAGMGLTVKTDTAYSEKYKKGFVMKQSIPPEQNVDEKTEILLTISLGSKPVEVGDYKKKKAEKIKKELEEQGISVSMESEYSSSVKKGYIISQSVKSGEKIYTGDKIMFTVSKGKEQVKVPDITGLSQAKASSELENAGLNMGGRTWVYSSSTDYGVIIEQKTDAGESVDIGSSVNVIISNGPKPERTQQSPTKATQAPTRATQSPTRATQTPAKPTQAPTEAPVQVDADDEVEGGELDVVN